VPTKSKRQKVTVGTNNSAATAISPVKKLSRWTQYLRDNPRDRVVILDMKAVMK
jgi:hypothetical protein